jgi:hypothetical protein
MDECKKHLSFKERELVILRETIDKIDEEKGRQLVETPSVKRMVEILERFLRKKRLICYGGTAINNILPEADQFYDRRLQIPDYDFFSKTPVDDAKELANIYAREGFDNVEAKAGVHYGTYKVFVDFIPIADITLLDKRLFDNLFKDSIRVNGIYYTPPNYLRMSMYLELSRPAGDVSRWEKVLKRLILLNKNYPLKSQDCGADVFFRRADSFDKEESEEIHDIVLGALADQGVVFFGGYASSLLSKYMPAKFRKMIEKQPDFDVLSLRPEETATIVQERLEYNKIRNVKVVEHKGLGEVIPPHYEVRIGHETVAFVYEPIACHSYNEIEAHGMRVKVASIDTILSLYLAFLYADRKYYDQERILCMASFLFDVQRHNRLAQKGLLKRFPSECYGEQHTIDTIRTEKAEMWMKLKDKRGTKEYEEWFLHYKPSEDTHGKSSGRRKKSSTRKHKGGSKARRTRARRAVTRRHRR